MKIDWLLKTYYRRRIAELEGADRPVTASRGAASPGPARWRRICENAVGAAVTAGWLLQLLLPDRWFLFGRIASVFRIGF
jgi:hypothetical protein